MGILSGIQGNVPVPSVFLDTFCDVIQGNGDGFGIVGDVFDLVGDVSCLLLWVTDTGGKVAQLSAEGKPRGGRLSYAGDQPFHLRHCSRPGPLIASS